MIDPDTFPLEADLSRADARLLVAYATGRRVVEVGAGGSTPLLAQVSKDLVSFEPEQRWRERVMARLARGERAGERHCRVWLREHDLPPVDAPRADVYFVDGPCHKRQAWVKAVAERNLAPVVLVHDSRRELPVAMLGCLLEWPLSARVDTLQLHAEGSNMLVVRLRREPVRYENWNETEPRYRLPHLR